ncbi:MAG TPA: hypothetical protein PKW88_08060, partial [Plasticicumulans sp.]|nr:hypothetical protein [Plasticicumulans sp.]
MAAGDTVMIGAAPVSCGSAAPGSGPAMSVAGAGLSAQMLAAATDNTSTAPADGVDAGVVAGAAAAEGAVEAAGIPSIETAAVSGSVPPDACTSGIDAVAPVGSAAPAAAPAVAALASPATCASGTTTAAATPKAP